MGPHRILILSDQPLFAQAVRSLVEASAHQVVAVGKPDAQTLARLEELKPDTIILGEDCSRPSPILPLLLERAHVRVIILTLDGNLIRVYEGHQVIPRNVQDLADLLNSATVFPKGEQSSNQDGGLAPESAAPGSKEPGMP